jgi:hypothetical protein
MSEIETLKKIRDQNRDRQKRYYLAHKEEINAKRKEIYRLGTNKNEPIPQPSSSKSVKTNFSKKRSITNDDVILALKSLDINEKTRETYLQNLKRFMMITECDDLIKCLKKYTEIIAIINGSTKSDGTEYAVNTKKALYQMILYLIDKLQLPITKTIKDKYSEQFNTLKIKSNDETKDKQETTTIETFDKYLEKIKSTFGGLSKEYVLSSLYKEVTLRDDFVLLIVPSIQSIDDNDLNYIVIPKTRELTLIINQYKTSNKYGQIKVKLSLPLSNLIRKYIQKETLLDGDYLFGNKNLTSFVSKMNKEIGIKGSISYFRQMSVSDLLRTSPSAEERQALSAKMAHAPLTQIKYLRNQ